MDEALFFKTVLALAPQGAYADEGWRLVADTGVPDEAVWRNSPGPSLLVCRGDAPALLERLSNAQAQVLQILEDDQSWINGNPRPGMGGGFMAP